MDTARKTIHHGGAEARRNPFLFEGPSPRRRLFQVVLILVACLILAGVRNGWSFQKQDQTPADQTKVAVVPITQEEHHHLVLENEYVRVFHVEVAPHSETKYHQHDMDYVFVTLGDSVVESVRVGEKPVKLELKDGDTRFTKGGFAHKAVNLSDKPFVNYTIEIKKGSVWPPEGKEVPCKPEAKDSTTHCLEGGIGPEVGDASERLCKGICYEAEGLFGGDGIAVRRVALDSKGAGRFWRSVEPTQGHMLIALANVSIGEGKSHWTGKNEKSIDKAPFNDRHALKKGEMKWLTDEDYVVYQVGKAKAKFILIEFVDKGMPH